MYLYVLGPSACLAHNTFQDTCWTAALTDPLTFTQSYLDVSWDWPSSNLGWWNAPLHTSHKSDTLPSLVSINLYIFENKICNVKSLLLYVPALYCSIRYFLYFIWYFRFVYFYFVWIIMSLQSEMLYSLSLLWRLHRHHRLWKEIYVERMG